MWDILLPIQDIDLINMELIFCMNWIITKIVLCFEDGNSEEESLSMRYLGSFLFLLLGG